MAIRESSVLSPARGAADGSAQIVFTRSSLSPRVRGSRDPRDLADPEPRVHPRFSSRHRNLLILCDLAGCGVRRPRSVPQGARVRRPCRFRQDSTNSTPRSTARRPTASCSSSWSRTRLRASRAGSCAAAGANAAWPRRAGFDLPSHDDGIDLVAEKTDGDLVAIQCKARSSGNVTPTHIQKFAGKANPRIFQERWLVTTTELTSGNERALGECDVIWKNALIELRQIADERPTTEEPDPRTAERGAVARYLVGWRVRAQRGSRWLTW